MDLPADVDVCPPENASTNGTGTPPSAPPPGFYDLADTYTVVVGSLIFLAGVPLTRLNASAAPIGGGLFAVLTAAALTVCLGVVRQDDVYDVIGRQGALTVVFLLLGTLVLADFADRERIAAALVRRLLSPSLGFESYLVRIGGAAFLLSALFSNDVCATLLTPLVLRVWEGHERSGTELDAILLMTVTSANIGAMATVFGSVQVAIVAASTDRKRFAASRLDMRACLTYLLPVAVALWMANVCLLMLHHRLTAGRRRRADKSKLVSDASQSDQEMAGLTAARPGVDVDVGGGGAANGVVNGYLPSQIGVELAGYDGVYFGPASTQHSDDRISIPCQLETIPEDDILQIGSERYDGRSPDAEPSGGVDADGGGGGPSTTADEEASTAALDRLSDASTSSSTSSSSSGSERDRMRNTDENLDRLNISYRPGALQSQNLTTAADSCTSLIEQQLERQSLVLCHRYGVYHSLRSFSVAHFLPSSAGPDDVSTSLPSDSRLFLVTLASLIVAVFVLLLVSGHQVKFDLGLVPLAAAVFAVVADAVINRRPALTLVRRADWSVAPLLFGLFVWMAGLRETGVVRYAWRASGLRAASSGPMEPGALALYGLAVLVAGNLFGSVPTALIVCDLLEPCANQRGVVLYLALLCTAGNNLTLYSGTANLIAVRRAIHVLDYRLPFLVHFQYGFLSSIVLLPFGVLLIYGMLLLGGDH